jgi:hypothetical protein
LKGTPVTEQQFIDRHRRYVAGVIGLGSSKVRKAFNGPLTNAQDFGDALMFLGDEADALLKRLYADLVKALAPVQPPVTPAAQTPAAVNGAAKQPLQPVQPAQPVKKAP